MKGRRIVRCTPEFFDILLRGAPEPRQTNAPEDIRMISARHDQWMTRGVVEILCESAEWDQVPEGALPPVFELTISALRIA